MALGVSQGLSPEPPSEEARRAEQARHDLYAYVQEAWGIVEPATQFVEGWHIKAICEHLQAVSNGEIKNLVINVPPRHAKSLLVSVFWPTWEWISSPYLRYIYSSYGQDLATRDAVKSRRLIQSPWYQKYFAESFRLTGDQNQKTRYENDKTGYRIATSLGGLATGEGGDRLCFPYDTLVTTEAGRVAIGELVEKRLPLKVLAYDHDTGCSRLRTVASYQKRQGRELALVRLSDGRTIRATWDHPFYVRGKGYTVVSQLSPNDELVDENQLRHLRSGSRQAKGPSSEEHQRSVLQSQVSWTLAERREQPRLSRRQGDAYLRDMQHAFLREAESCEARRRSLLFEGLPGDRAQERATQSCNPQVRDLRYSCSQAAFPCEGEQLLLSNMRRQGSWEAHVEGGESSLRTRHELGAVLCAISSDGSSSEGEGWANLPALRNESHGTRQGVRCSSRQLQQRRQSYGELGLPMPLVSREDARRTGESYAMDQVLVESIERDETPEHVYNLTVSKDHNYFVDGILAHNCMDDPHKLADAHSDTALLNAVTFWNETMSTRGNDPETAAKVVIMQRVHEADVTGDIIEKMEAGGEQYELLILPAEYEPKRSYSYRKDPRRGEGELLWPERFSRESIESLKVSLGEQASGQLQQRPVPAGGAIFKREWWDGQNRYDPNDFRMLNTAYAHYFAWDTANKKEDRNAYTAGVCGTLLPDYRLIIRYAVMDRKSFDELEEFVTNEVRPFNVDLKLRAVAVEDAASGTQLLQTVPKKGEDWIRGLVTPVTPNPLGKEANWEAASDWCRQGCVLLPHPSEKTPWLNTLENPLFKVPAAKFVDVVDAFSILVNYVEETEGAFSTRLNYVRSRGVA